MREILRYMVISTIILLKVTHGENVVLKAEESARSWLLLQENIVSQKREWKRERQFLELENKLLFTSVNKKELEEKKLETELSKKNNDFALIKNENEINGKLSISTRIMIDNLWNKLLSLETQLAPFTKEQFIIWKNDKQASDSLNKYVTSCFAAYDHLKMWNEKWHYSQSIIAYENTQILCNVLYAGVKIGYALAIDEKCGFIGFSQDGSWRWSVVNEAKLKNIKAMHKVYNSGGLEEVKIYLPQGVLK